MSKAIQLASLSQKATRNLLLKKTPSPTNAQQVKSLFAANSLILPLGSTSIQRRNKTWYAEPKDLKESREIMLVSDDPDYIWRQPPSNSKQTTRKPNYILEL